MMQRGNFHRLKSNEDLGPMQAFVQQRSKVPAISIPGSSLLLRKESGGSNRSWKRAPSSSSQESSTRPVLDPSTKHTQTSPKGSPKQHRRIRSLMNPNSNTDGASASPRVRRRNSLNHRKDESKPQRKISSTQREDKAKINRQKNGLDSVTEYPVVPSEPPQQIGRNNLSTSPEKSIYNTTEYSFSVPSVTGQKRRNSMNNATEYMMEEERPTERRPRRNSFTNSATQYYMEDDNPQIVRPFVKQKQRNSMDSRQSASTASLEAYEGTAVFMSPIRREGGSIKSNSPPTTRRQKPGTKVGPTHVYTLSPETPIQRRRNSNGAREPADSGHVSPGELSGRQSVSSKRTNPQTPVSGSITTPASAKSSIGSSKKGSLPRIPVSPPGKQVRSKSQKSEEGGRPYVRKPESPGMIIPEPPRQDSIGMMIPKTPVYSMSPPNMPRRQFSYPLQPSQDMTDLVRSAASIHVDGLDHAMNGRAKMSDDEQVDDEAVVEIHDSGEDEEVHEPHHSPVESPGQKLTNLYEYARSCEWDLVLQECQVNPRDANCVCDKDGTTALHLAVMSRSNPVMRDGLLDGYEPAPRLVIEALLVACPEAAITRCTIKRYTPLTYACLVSDEGYDMDDAADMVSTILRHAPQSAYVFTDDGFSALDIHILSYSRLHGHKQEVYSGSRTSTVVLKSLLVEKPFLADARTYRNKIRGPVELLYRSNMQHFKETVTGGGGSDQGGAFATVASTLSDWWAWKWVLLLLKHASLNENPRETKFAAVRSAARLVGCPIPILKLALSMFPKQIESRDPRGDLYNMPLHEVASWRCDAEIICGDPFVIRRKRQAIELLLEEYPDAARTTNNMGETALQLAIEAGTPWDGGLELLVRACAKALKFARRLRNITDANKHLLSISYHSKVTSVPLAGDDDSDDEEEPVRAIEGMYPFMVAAVLSRVPEDKRRGPSFLFVDQSPEEHLRNLTKKELESVRCIYGLLRARPDALARYRNDMMKKYLREMNDQKNDVQMRRASGSHR